MRNAACTAVLAGAGEERTDVSGAIVHLSRPVARHRPLDGVDELVEGQGQSARPWQRLSNGTSPLRKRNPPLDEGDNPPDSAVLGQVTRAHLQDVGLDPYRLTKHPVAGDNPLRRPCK
jgi:hypothetical protein